MILQTSQHFFGNSFSGVGLFPYLPYGFSQKQHRLFVFVFILKYYYYNMTKNKNQFFKIIHKREIFAVITLYPKRSYKIS
jgi:hypothetical protein